MRRALLPILTGLATSIGLALLLGTTAPAAAGTLIGSGTLNNPDDLTIILTSGGDPLEFLDLSETAGLSVAAALAAYGPSGFRWADGAEVGELFDAFGISYASAPSGVTDLGLAVTSAEAISFLSFLGSSSTPDRTAGWVDDLTSATFHTYTCISIDDGCSPAAFTNNTSDFWPTHPQIGVYLVRDIPEPTTALLLACGLVGLGVRRRLH